MDDRLMDLWLDVEQLASTITFSDEEDSLVWQFNSNGIYSTQFINFRGILLSPCACCMSGTSWAGLANGLQRFDLSWPSRKHRR